MATTFSASPDSAPPRAPTSGDASDDAALVARALSGDRVAEANIYRRHARSLAGLAARLLGCRTEAEDVVQDTFARALEHLASLRDPSLLRAWLVRIAVTQCQRRLRRRRLLRWLGLDRTSEDLRLDAMVSPDTSPEVCAELSRVAAVLSSTPENERIAWMLHRVEGETLEATATACACSLATVKRRVAAVEQHLQRRLSHPPERMP
jgi:RNA polymerase sigma-70 factor (ECF subfamily)